MLMVTLSYECHSKQQVESNFEAYISSQHIVKTECRDGFKFNIGSTLFAKWLNSVLYSNFVLPSKFGSWLFHIFQKWAVKGDGY